MRLCRGQAKRAISTRAAAAAAAAAAQTQNAEERNTEAILIWPSHHIILTLAHTIQI